MWEEAAEDEEVAEDEEAGEEAGEDEEEDGEVAGDEEERLLPQHCDKCCKFGSFAGRVRCVGAAYLEA